MRQQLVKPIKVIVGAKLLFSFLVGLETTPNHQKVNQTNTTNKIMVLSLRESPYSNYYNYYYINVQSKAQQV